MEETSAARVLWFGQTNFSYFAGINFREQAILIYFAGFFY